jgi:2-polyprenyl-3-methyl-5-hydroxy-6-metoxy-1,4-benzoquinol methylase
MPQFAQRSGEAEWLDSPDISPAELQLVLKDLAWFNGSMLGHLPVVRWLARATKRAGGVPYTILDVGCGYGDLLRAIRRWAARKQIPVKLIGLDLSEKTIRIAREATDPKDQIEYRAADIFAFKPPERIDFIVSSLLTHHFSDAQIVSFLRWMETTAQRGWLIYDLQRHIIPYTFIGLASRLMRLHPMVTHDGQISVKRSLTPAEWHARIAKAGMPRDAVRVRWFLYRLIIERLR